LDHRAAGQPPDNVAGAASDAHRTRADHPGDDASHTNGR